MFRGAGIALDIAKGLHFLHSHHVMHLDLKSPNILLAQDGTAKIADVGLSRMFTTRSLPVAKVSNLVEWLHTFVYTGRGNVKHSAPNVIHIYTYFSASACSHDRVLCL